MIGGKETEMEGKRERERREGKKNRERKREKKRESERGETTRKEREMSAVTVMKSGLETWFWRKGQPIITMMMV